MDENSNLNDELSESGDLSGSEEVLEATQEISEIAETGPQSEAGAETETESAFGDIVATETLDDAQQKVIESEQSGALDSLSTDDITRITALYGDEVFNGSRLQSVAEDPSQPVDAEETSSLAEGDQNDAESTGDTTEVTDVDAADGDSDSVASDPVTESSEPSLEESDPEVAPSLETDGVVGSGDQGSDSFADQLLRLTTTQAVMTELDSVGWEAGIAQLDEQDIQRIVNRFDVAALLSQYQNQVGEANGYNSQTFSIPELEVDKAIVSEGESFAVSVISGEPNQTYTWFIDSQPSAVANTWDFSYGPFDWPTRYSQTVTTDANGDASFVLTPIEDRKTEGSEEIQIALSGPGYSSQELPVATVTLEDTSRYAYVATEGDDVIAASYASSLVSPDDVLFGLEGDDTIFGHAGDDTLYGGPGNDTLYGGKGSDTAAYIGNASMYTADWRFDEETGDFFWVVSPTSPDNRSGTDQLARDIELIQFGDQPAMRLSDFVEERVVLEITEGTGASDTLFGSAGNDWIKAGDGDDVLYASDAADLFDGGNGFDRLIIDASYADAVHLGGDYVGQSIRVDDQIFSISGIEVLEFTDRSVLVTFGSGLFDAAQIAKGALILDQTASASTLVAAAVSAQLSGVDRDIEDVLVETSELADLSARDFIARLFVRVTGYEASEDELSALTSDLASQSFGEILELAKSQPQMNTLLQDSQSPVIADGLGLFF